MKSIYTEKKEEQICVLCLDPQSKLFYVQNLTTHAIWLPQPVPQDFQRRGQQEIAHLKSLIDFREYQWVEGHSVECYRRRSIPEHLLKRPKYMMPCYVSQSKLPRAINESEKIELHINFSEYRAQKQSDFTQQILSVYILTAVPEILKSLFREVYEKESKRFLQLKSDDHQFCLKHQGYVEYLFGRHPIINFQCVRKALEEHRPLNLQLSQIQKETISRVRFPPLFRQNNQRAREVPWRQLRESQILMYYPPIPFTMENLKSIQQVQKIVSKGHIEESLRQEFSDRHKDNVELIKAIKVFEIGSKKRQYVTKPRTKEEALKNLAKRTKDIQEKVIFTKKNLIYSGECEYDFQFVLVGIDNFYSLFQMGEESPNKHKTQLSINNGQFQPSYLSKLRTDHKELPIRLYKKDHGSQVLKNFATFGPYGYRTQRSNSTFNPYAAIIRVCLYHGTKKLFEWNSKAKTVANQLRYNDLFRYPTLSRITLEGRLTFEVIAENVSGDWIVVGSGVKKIFDCNSLMEHGLQEIVLWPFYSIDPRLSTGMQDFSGYFAEPYAKLFIKFPEYAASVHWSLRSPTNIFNLKWSTKPPSRQQNKKTSESINELQKLIKINPIYSKELSFEQKKLLTLFRHDYKGLSHKMSLFLDAIDWDNPDQVHFALEARNYWTKLTPVDALTLLDANYVDQSLRVYACQCLNNFSDDQLQFYMPQLVQALTFQSQHFSILGELLLDRALQNLFVVGFALYCEIKAQLQFKITFERLALILQQFIMLCGGFRTELVRANQSSKLLERMTMAIKTVNIQTAVEQFIEKVERPFKIPIEPRLQLMNIYKDHCQIKGSKKKPMGVSFLTAHGQQVKYFLKIGDDLRQDSFIIQIMKFMNRIWLDAGISTELCFYKVQSLRDYFGIIEAIDAQTLHYIQTKDGNLGTFKNSVIYDYLKHISPDEKHLKIVEKNFMHSLAGSVVSTYVLGVADRHPSNVMLTDKGQFFHIDYGNIMGKFKEKIIKRQISPFLFTQDIAFVLGGRKGVMYERFAELCGKLYVLVRRKADQIINLMMMMISAGMPQMNKLKDIEYCLNMLSLQLSETEAKLKIKEQLIESLNNETRRRFDNFAHNIKHD